MSKEPQEQSEKQSHPKSAEGVKGAVPPNGGHSPMPCEDAEWEGRMDELEAEREELHKGRD